MGVYNAEISAGSLMPLESRRIAALLLRHPTEQDWNHALKTDNLLQKKTPATARRQARLIRNRLNTVNEKAWEMIASGDQEVVLQTLLVAAIKHSQLLGDFIRTVYAERLRRLELNLSFRDWEGFLTECTHRDSVVADWSASTKVKLFQVIVRILAETKYLDSTRRMTLTPQSVHPEVERYLKSQGEAAILDLMEQRR